MNKKIELKTVFNENIKNMLIEEEKHIFDITNGKVYRKLKNNELRETGLCKNTSGYHIFEL